ncbi:hypothetical protein DSO57_1003728 [Entomophthora muscae]|uniref:Uncharacterized protein n=1 Tax=Entomophthora muscae TaxID=34485 RepID=A0ACC2SXF5_9FUNG|nr:hypothetical protein DSO57_1003728 [Entomophthora muscae]
MKEIPTAPPLPNAPPTQDFSKLGFVYITVLGMANQVVPHTGSWRPLATALNYLVRIALIVYMAFQAWPASPVGAQPDSDMGCDSMSTRSKLVTLGPVVIHMCAVLQVMVDLASNKDNMLKNDNVWLADDAVN